ncbi:hypothetical protein H2248_005979 [Termitomyces sp. 'cryptogamus']|nr:hypothetical protein H2248_005979 [Termitomyces sp. 'cryptogamus']
MPDHYTNDPYNVKNMFEGAKQVLKGTDASTPKSITTTSHPGLVPAAAAVATPTPTDNQSLLIALLPLLFKTGYTMVCSGCLQLELYIQQGKCCHNAEGKMVLPSSTMIPNYSSKHLYMEHINEWHFRNPGQLATRCLTGHTNSNAEQDLHQMLIHEVLHLDSNGPRPLFCKEHIKLLEREYLVLQLHKVFDGVEVLHVKGFCLTPPSAPAPATAATNSAPATASMLVTRAKHLNQLLVLQLPSQPLVPLALSCLCIYFPVFRIAISL